MKTAIKIPDALFRRAKSVAAEQFTGEERQLKAQKHPPYPMEIEGSVITETWREYIIPKERLLRGFKTKGA